MNDREYVLSCLAEECAEVAQCVSKALRFGLREIQAGQSLTNAERIVEELADLISVAAMLEVDGAIPGFQPDGATIAAKAARIAKFASISRATGALKS